MRILAYALLISLIAGQGVHAANKYPSDPNELLRAKSYPIIKDPNELRDLLQSRWDAVIILHKNKDIDEKVKVEQIYKIVSPLFNFPLIAKLTLGRTHWPKLNQTQREKFTRLESELSLVKDFDIGLVISHGMIDNFENCTAVIDAEEIVTAVVTVAKCYAALPLVRLGSKSSRNRIVPPELAALGHGADKGMRVSAPAVDRLS